MRIHRGTSRAEHRGASAAIGNFDGVHLGHQAIIDVARDARPGAPLGVVTFEPHPRQVFAPGAPPFRLMNAEARANRLARLGVDVLHEVPFDASLAALTPEAFCRDILVERLGLAHATVGRDFRFGKGRAGDAATLERLGAEMGFGVTVAPLLDLGGIEVSSTRIREALAEGRPEDAAKMLGHLHRIEGEVLHGEKRGRTLGYPTANMALEGLMPPKLGVYAVKVRVLGGPHAGDYAGVASVGTRPMFGENEANIETHLFDFDGDLYGEHLSVALVRYLRGEEKFGSLEALVQAMDRDSDAARAVLGA